MEINKFGIKLKTRRMELQLTLKELSEKSGIMSQLLSDYENMKKEPGIKNLLLLSNALGVSSDYLINDSYDTRDKILLNSYGSVLRYYTKALKLSQQDRLVVNAETNQVIIEINDEILKKVFIQLESVHSTNNEIYDALTNFNVNILNNIEIK